MTSTDTAASSSPPGRWLDQADPVADQPIDPPVHLWGFGGLHGGLTLALLAKATYSGEDAGMMRSATVRLHRPINQAFTVAISRPRRGRVSADALPADGDRLCLASASLVTGAIRPQWLQPVIPDCPPVPPHGNCKRFGIPPGLVPIGQFLEVRPTDSSRPYAGGPRPVLTAWLRLTEDDQPPDIFRLIMLMDALAPSYAAVLTTPQAIPTVELTVRYAGDLRRASSPWILLRASTTWVSADGWLNEHLDAWDPEGTHLASADQLRAISSSLPAAAARLEQELPS
jgi:Thioesterase-like superfamily